MPYIVTTRRDPAEYRHEDGTEPCTCGHPSAVHGAGWAACVREDCDCRQFAEPPISRRAVATLDEMHRAVIVAAERVRAGRTVTADALAALSSGGTVGPLPDGTVIEVAQTVSWGGAPIGMARWLREEQGWSIPREMDDEQACAAYNAAQDA